MKLKIMGIVVLSLVMASSLALADSLTYSGATFLPFVNSEAGTGNPFWANHSLDGSQLNVGYILTGKPSPYTVDYIGYGSTNSSDNAQYLGTSGGGVVNNVSITTNKSPTSQFDTLIVTIAGNKAGNRFGVYDIATASNTSGNASFLTSSSAQEIIPGNQTAGSTYTANITYAHYGFYFYTQPSRRLVPVRSDQAPDTALTEYSNFAFFQSTLQPHYLLHRHGRPQAVNYGGKDV